MSPSPEEGQTRGNPVLGADPPSIAALADPGPDPDASPALHPVDPRVLESRGRLISYIARQIALDLLREGRPTPGKET